VLGLAAIVFGWVSLMWMFGPLALLAILAHVAVMLLFMKR